MKKELLGLGVAQAILLKCRAVQRLVAAFSKLLSC
jgi:hypothetical protein